MNRTVRKLKAKMEKYLFPCHFQYYKEPLHFTKGNMQYLYDSDGTEYLDFFGGIVTVSVGHANPEVTERVTEQMKKLGHVSTVYLTDPMVELAEKFAKLAPGKLQKSFFVNSGSEATEGVALASRIATGSDHFLALDHAYHGRTLTAMAFTGQKQWRAGRSHPVSVSFVPNPYCYRCPYGLEYPSCDVRCARDVERVIESSTSGRPAAMIAEPIQGVGGIVTPPPEYFKILKRILKKHGVLFIADEVQTGWGRTGDKWFGIEHWDTEPDLMSTAKSMGSGFPIGAFIATPKVADKWTHLSISTYGGNPISATAALAVIDIIKREKLYRNTKKIGNILLKGLNAMKERYPVLGDVRGKGLMLGMELVGPKKAPAPQKAAAFMEECKERKLLVGKGGIHGNVIRLAPPMIIGEEDAARALEIMDQALATL